VTQEPKHLTLFLTGDAPRSRRARSNLAAALHRAGADMDAVHEVDLLADPQQALAHGIFATPALMLDTAAGTPAIMYGDLSEHGKLDSFLADWFAPAA